jgi:hypothetical protein
MDRLSSPKRTDGRVGRAQPADASYIANSVGIGECGLAESPPEFAEHNVSLAVVLRTTKSRQ